MKRIAVGLPSRTENNDFQTITGIMQVGGTWQISMHKAICGLVGLSNNIVWCEFLNRQVNQEKELHRDAVDYFIMLHDDIAPLTADWIDILVAEIERLDADVVAAIVPYKDDSGRTSTGIADEKDPFQSTRRLTLKECFKLPETFGQEICPPGKLIQINTGCMIVNAKKPWVISGDVWFENYDQIVWVLGKFHPVAVSEDENFSRKVQQLGGKVYATRKVQVEHRGTGRYRNTEPWGKATDEQYATTFGEGEFTYDGQDAVRSG